jgi:hypothetical protein
MSAEVLGFGVQVPARLLVFAARSLSPWISTGKARFWGCPPISAMRYSKTGRGAFRS